LVADAFGEAINAMASPDTIRTATAPTANSLVVSFTSFPPSAGSTSPLYPGSERIVWTIRPSIGPLVQGRKAVLNAIVRIILYI
jgi:hypothetical protein